VAGQALHVFECHALSSRSVIVVTRKECGDRRTERPASMRRRFTMRQTSITCMGLLVSWPVFLYAVRKRGVSLRVVRRPVLSMHSKVIFSRSCRTGISRLLPFFSSKWSMRWSPAW